MRTCDTIAYRLTKSGKGKEESRSRGAEAGAGGDRGPGGGVDGGSMGGHQA